ncbi:cupin domain-containing protein [uncultured Selenomonas sp.]|uniref:cupin domain-containing protein n=1 Tax=uncultured Selenomonas sp. TaxID=159275 RepID=UPI0028DBB04A|nr:cupin domain-containing protein [uncultured Selenomonas sp.]
MPILQENIEVRKNAAGGKGEVCLEHLLSKEQMHDKCSTFARITIKPGCSLGYHQHKGNSEAYYILKGKGIYNNNGTEVEVGPGTTTFCPDGEFHALSNEDGTEDLVFMALIINS